MTMVPSSVSIGLRLISMANSSPSLRNPWSSSPHDTPGYIHHDDRQPGQAHVAVIDRQLVTFSDQPLDQLDHRTSRRAIRDALQRLLTDNPSLRHT